MRSVRFEGQVSQFVDDKELWLGEISQSFVEPTISMRFRKSGDQSWGGNEQDRVPNFDCFSANGDRQMSLANAGRAKKKNCFAIGDKSSRRDFAGPGRWTAGPQSRNWKDLGRRGSGQNPLPFRCAARLYGRSPAHKGGSLLREESTHAD